MYTVCIWHKTWLGSEFLELNLKSKIFRDNLVLGFIANIHIH